MIIIWAPSASPQSTTYGSDLTPDEVQFEKEYWKPRTTFRCAGLSTVSSSVLHTVRCTTMQVYDLAWSPTGEYIIAGSTDNTARVFASADGVYASTSTSLRCTSCFRKMCLRNCRTHSLCSRCRLGPPQRIYCNAEQRPLYAHLPHFYEKWRF